MSKSFRADYEEMESGAGVLDIAIRFNTNTAEYEFVVEENGLPTQVPAHVFVGILHLIANTHTIPTCGVNRDAEN